MDKPDRTAAEPAEDTPERRYDNELDTGHPAWVRIVTLVVLAVFLLATLVAALA